MKQALPNTYNSIAYAILVSGVLTCGGAASKDIQIELLRDNVTPANVGNLDGLACRNFDRIVHLKISVDWPCTGGTHQAVSSVAFAKVDDDKVLLNPAVEEIEAKGRAYIKY